MNDAEPATRITVEVCIASLDAARQAENAGADRIELNSALELDGLTPSAGLVKLVASAIRIPIIAMARPRAGDFCYCESEWKTLTAEARWLLDHGVDGLAFGCLNSQRQIDFDRCHEMRELAGSHDLVFHKAFDEVRDWSGSLECLIEAGVNRVMTSGLKNTALAGVPTLSAMVRQAAGRIEVLPAGQIRSENAVKIVQQTGCDQVHGSFSTGSSSTAGDEICRTIEALASRPITS